MSAFVPNKSHIDAIIGAGVRWSKRYPATWYAGTERKQLTLETADETGDMLVREAVRSVSYRYQDNGDLPGPIDAYYLEPYTFGHSPFSLPWPEPVAILKALDCYEYQACEHPDWEQSEAYDFCQSLRRQAISKLPGYDEAAWEITTYIQPDPRRVAS